MTYVHKWIPSGRGLCSPIVALLVMSALCGQVGGAMNFAESFQQLCEPRSIGNPGSTAIATANALSKEHKWQFKDKALRVSDDDIMWAGTLTTDEQIVYILLVHKISEVIPGEDRWLAFLFDKNGRQLSVASAEVSSAITTEAPHEAEFRYVSRNVSESYLVIGLGQIRGDISEIKNYEARIEIDGQSDRYRLDHNPKPRTKDSNRIEKELFRLEVVKGKWRMPAM